jgi:hypothetical protein
MRRAKDDRLRLGRGHQDADASAPAASHEAVVDEDVLLDVERLVAAFEVAAR